MNHPGTASQQYLRAAVLTATAEQLHLMLVDGAIRFALRGADCLEANDSEGAFHAFDRAQRIVLQMQAGLRREVHPEIVDQLSGLYNFIYRRLIDANVRRDRKAVDDALRILRHHRETWAMLLEKLGRETAPAGVPAVAGPGATGERPALCVEG